MKKLLVVLTLVVAGSSSLALAKVSHSSADERTIIIRVTSTNPGEEMRFDASYIFRGGDSQLQNVEHQTPFEIKAKSDYIAGIFRKRSGSGDLRVTVTTSADGEAEKGYVSGSGELVVLSTSPQSLVATKPEAKYSFTIQALALK
jgi:hypothetical protein